MSRKTIPYMTNEEIDEAIAHEIMGWKEGRGLAGGGCRPANAKPTPKIPEFEPSGRRKMYGGCEMGSRGGTYPYIYYGTLFRSKPGFGEQWTPTECYEQAMEVVHKIKGQLSIIRKGPFYTVTFGDTSYAGRNLALAICKAALQHVRYKKRKNGKPRKA